MTECDEEPEATLEGGEPLVSIGLPVQGNMVLFEQAVRSIFAQTYARWELIIFCDGASPDVVESAFQLTDSRVRVIVSKSSVGLPNALNAITDAAKGSLIARMDSDDIMMPNRIEQQVSLFERDPALHVASSRAIMMDDQTRILGVYREPRLPTVRSEYLQSGVLTHPAVMARTLWMKRHRYDQAWIRTEDKELWLRTLETAKLFKTEEPLVFYRVSPHFSIKKQAITARFDRKLVWHYRASFGRLSIAKALVYSLRSAIKQAIFAVATAMTLTDWIYRKKYNPLAGDVLETHVSSLAHSQGSAVPGWPKPAQSMRYESTVWRTRDKHTDAI